MKIGVFSPNRMGYSHQVYISNITRELKVLGVNCVFFARNQSLPIEADLYWDPRAAAGRAPYRKLAYASKPLVVTVHGASPFALPAHEHYDNLVQALFSKLTKMKRQYDWRCFKNKYAGIITVSKFAKDEIEQCLKLDGEKIYAVHHGVDHRRFYPTSRRRIDVPYFLNVSAYQPLKNLDRVLKAYERAASRCQIGLISVCPGYRKEVSTKGVRLIRYRINQELLMNFYQAAMAFVLPSLRESFGMPILEAMACGCPVITSNISACSEVAGDAALLVDPRSIESIYESMLLIITDEELRRSLRRKGLIRAKEFSWRKSAEGHLRVFERALES